ncbi:MAG: hypothetical protein ACP5HM_13180 [Anaerolineae bacterium]
MSVLWQQRTHGVQKRRERENRPIVLLFLVVVVVMLLLAAAYGALAGANARLGARVWRMEQALIAQQRENQALLAEIARLSSIPVLQQRAGALGYVRAESIEFLKIAEP